MNPDAEFAPEEPIGPGEAIVQVPTNYSAYVELGTVRMASQPFLTPAVELVASQAENIAREVFNVA